MIELVAMGVAVLVVVGAKLAYDRWLSPDENEDD